MAFSLTSPARSLLPPPAARPGVKGPRTPPSCSTVLSEEVRTPSLTLAWLIRALGSRVGSRVGSGAGSSGEGRGCLWDKSRSVGWTFSQWNPCPPFFLKPSPSSHRFPELSSFSAPPLFLAPPRPGAKGEGTLCLQKQYLYL